MSEISEERRKELTENIRKQVALEEKAFRIVEKLVDLTPSEESLKADLQLITSDQYCDIVEERSIAKLCGYPLCSNGLTDVVTKKYHISVKSKTVYDISKRKNFCSNKCYNASEYLQGQIPSAPVWLRGKEPTVDITFMSPELNRGSVGEVIVTRSKTELEEDLALLRKIDSITLNPENAQKSHAHKRCHSAELENSDDDDRNSSDEVSDEHESELCSESDSRPTTVDVVHLTSDSQPAAEAIPRSAPPSRVVQKPLKSRFRNCIIDVSGDRQNPSSSAGIEAKLAKFTKRNTQRAAGTILLPTDVRSAPSRIVVLPDKTSNSTPNVPTAAGSASLAKVKLFLREWKTPATVALINPGATNGHADRNKHDVDIDERQLESRLRAYDKLLDGDSCAETSDIPTKKLPDLEKLRDGGKHYEMQVKEFYSQPKKQVHFSTNDPQAADFEAKEVVLPLVHSHSLNAIRRKLVLDKLSQVLGDIIEHTHLRLNDVSSSVHILVQTFSLSSKNILLKSGEWKLAGYILLKVLAERDMSIREALNGKTCEKFVAQLLADYSASNAEVEEIVREMTLPVDNVDSCESEQNNVIVSENPFETLD